MPEGDVIYRLVTRVEYGADDACWPWLGGCDDDGYGALSIGGRRMGKAHRLAYELWVGPIAAGHVIAHRCDNPPCCNPRHLRATTQTENMAEMNARGRRRGDGLPFGEDHGNAKLTAAAARTIREWAPAGWSQRDLAAAFGVAQSQVWSVLAGRTWSHA